MNRPLDWAQGLLQTVLKPSRGSNASNGRGVCTLTDSSSFNSGDNQVGGAVLIVEVGGFGGTAASALGRMWRTEHNTALAELSKC